MLKLMNLLNKKEKKAIGTSFHLSQQLKSINISISIRKRELFLKEEKKSSSILKTEKNASNPRAWRF